MYVEEAIEGVVTHLIQLEFIMNIVILIKNEMDSAETFFPLCNYRGRSLTLLSSSLRLSCKTHSFSLPQLPFPKGRFQIDLKGCVLIQDWHAEVALG